MSQQKFRQTVARAEQVGADVLAAAQQVADRFLLVGRHMDRRQRAGPIEDRELARVAPIGRDAVARSTRDERRGNDLTGEARGGQRPLQLEATRAGLIAAPDAPLSRATRFTKRTIVGLSDVSECNAGVRWPGNRTAATVVAAC